VPSFFLWRFGAFLNKGSSKTPPKTFWGKSMSTVNSFWLLAEKAKKKKNLRSCRLFPSIFFIVFLHEEPENTTKVFSKNQI
jgi:hypothetical protein